MQTPAENMSQLQETSVARVWECVDEQGHGMKCDRNMCKIHLQVWTWVMGKQWENLDKEINGCTACMSFQKVKRKRSEKWQMGERDYLFPLPCQEILLNLVTFFKRIPLGGTMAGGTFSKYNPSVFGQAYTALLCTASGASSSRRSWAPRCTAFEISAWFWSLGNEDTWLVNLSGHSTCVGYTKSANRLE